jgi:uncharacterized protein involved in outer membrane biogenesis
VKFLSSKRRRLAAGAVLLLLLFVLRPGASPLKSRIIASISSAIGRSVDISSVHIRLLPSPGFDLENLVVYDDPSFGAEPMLRASEVTASLRLTSLLRGRIEIARLDLTEPSLNVVHADSGRWNLEALVERTSHMPLAPTSKPKLERRAGFPYIEATSARINFKSGPEKKSFALTGADFSLWQESEDAWGVRLKAQPVRTDLNLNDTGMLQISGKWQRASTLRETPLDFSVEWRRAQLGQLTKLFTRNDQGWRGGADFEATLSGTPAKLAVSSSLAVQDFRRYDITSGEPMRLAARCDSEYSSLDHTFHEVICNAPVETGLIALKGDMGLPGSHRYGLVLIADNVPAAALVALAQRTKKNLPEDLMSAGVLRGNLTIDEAPESPLQVEGRGQIDDFRLASAVNKIEIAPGAIPFVLTSGEGSEGHVRLKNHRKAESKGSFAGPRLDLGPIPLTAERGMVMTLQGWINRAGYNFTLTGDTGIGRALHLTRMIGLPSLNTTAEGLAQLDLQIAGGWGWNDSTQADVFVPQITGTAKLRSVRVPVRGTEEPIEIASANLQLDHDVSRIDKLNAIAAGATWTGSLEVPRGCGTPSACEVHFKLKADHVALDDLSHWASPPAKEQPWYHVLESTPQAKASLFSSLRASGRLTADHLQLKKFSVDHVSASVQLDRGELQLSELQASFLGGSHLGNWQADFTVKPAVCKASGNLTGLQLARLADKESAPALSGTADATYQVSGACTLGTQASIWTSFWASATGTFKFEFNNGMLPGFSLVQDEESLKFASLSGQARLHDGTIETKDAQLDSSSGKFLLSGTASFQRELKLKLSRGANPSAGGYAITGTLAEPKISPLPGAEQARLKTETAKP